MKTLLKIAKTFVISVGIIFIGFLIFGSAIYEKDWTTVIGILIFGLLMALAYGVVYLWQRYVTRIPVWGRFTSWIDSLLIKTFIEPLKSRFQSETGINLPGPNEPLVFSELDSIDVQKFDRSFESLKKHINNFYFIAMAPICLLLLITAFVVLIPWFKDYHTAFGSIILGLGVVVIIVTLILFKTVILLGDFLKYIQTFRLVKDIGDEFLSKEERASAKKQLENLMALVQHRKLELSTLQADIQILTSAEGSLQDSFLNILKATIDAPAKDLKQDLIKYHKESGRIESRRSLIQDIVLGTLFLLAGLFIGQIPNINNWISNLLKILGL